MSGREERLSTADIAAADRPLAREEEARPEAADARDTEVSFVDEADATDLRRRWEEIQIEFVDEPREAVERADELVAEVVQAVARTFAAERDGLEEQWKRGDDVSTEELRVALQRYRAFFERLLAV